MHSILAFFIWTKEIVKNNFVIQLLQFERCILDHTEKKSNIERNFTLVAKDKRHNILKANMSCTCAVQHSLKINIIAS